MNSFSSMPRNTIQHSYELQRTNKILPPSPSIPSVPCTVKTFKIKTTMSLGIYNIHFTHTPI